MTRAVLFDRDGTLVVDVPYNGDPDAVRPMPDALAAVRQVRAAGLALGVVSNQSGIGRGLITSEDVARVNARVDTMLGAFDTWQVCPHTEHAGCPCRKPRPGLVHYAAAALGVSPRECVVIGDIGDDVGAASAAGALSILVPTSATLPAEIDSADVVAPDLSSAVAFVLGSADAAHRRLGGRRSRAP